MVGKIPTPMEIHKAIFLDTIRTALTPFLGEPNTDENRVKMAHVVAKIIKKGF